MVRNERQYEITRDAADRFRKAIGDFEEESAGLDMDPRLVAAQREALESQLGDLVDEMSEYERLRSGSVSELPANSFEELADGLIKARIASGLAQGDVAARANIEERRMRRHEDEGFASASFREFREIAGALGVSFTGSIRLPAASSG